MIHLHPQPEPQRIDWHGAALAWIATWIVLLPILVLDFLRS